MIRESYDTKRSQYLCYNQSDFIKAFNIISKILYFESHPEASTLMIRRYENNHISKLEVKLLSKTPNYSLDDEDKFAIDPKDIVAKYNIPTGEKSDIVIMLYKDEHDKKTIYNVNFPSVFSDSLKRVYLFIPENAVSFDALEEDRDAAIDMIIYTLVRSFGKVCSIDTNIYRQTISDIFAALLGVTKSKADPNVSEYVKKFSEFVTPETDSDAMIINIPDNCSLFDELAIDVKYSN